MSRDALEGRSIVVTGAASGQGLREAILLAQAGARVIALDAAPEAPRELDGPDIAYATLDVTDESAWADLAARLRSELDGSPLHGLVNNAGVTHRATIAATEVSAWDRVLAVNLTGPMLGMRALAPLMGEGSSIVNIGSVAALTGHYTAAYTASKWGLRGLTHAAATEYGGRGIRVNVIHPGFIDTPMTANAPDAMRSAQLLLTPLKRVGAPDEVAGLVVFLMTDAAAYITGAEIPVDGGYTLSGSATFMADRIAEMR